MCGAVDEYKRAGWSEAMGVVGGINILTYAENKGAGKIWSNEGKIWLNEGKTCCTPRLYTRHSDLLIYSGHFFCPAVDSRSNSSTKDRDASDTQTNK